MALNADLQALRDYVTAETGAQNQAESTVRLLVTHSNLKAKFMEIRLDLHVSISISKHLQKLEGNYRASARLFQYYFETIPTNIAVTDRQMFFFLPFYVLQMTVASVKNKLCFHCGTSPSAMLLQLKDEAGHSVLAVLGEDRRQLGFYSPRDGCVLHIVDTDPTSVSANGWLEDVSKVAKYVMSDEDYEKRENTYRKFKQERLRMDPTWTLEKEIAARRGVPYVPTTSNAGGMKTDDPEYMAVEATEVEIGARCEVQSQEGSKRGEVRYVGKVDGLPLGWWIGVRYDEPVGKNDGSIKGKKYFECPAGYGAFVRPNLVSTGDFPPFDEDFEFSDGDEI
jgi:tubulin-specific chaperone B